MSVEGRLGEEFVMDRGDVCFLVGGRVGVNARGKVGGGYEDRFVSEVEGDAHRVVCGAEPGEGGV